MYNASFSKLKCEFCVVIEAVGLEKMTEEDKTVIRFHLALDHGWICEEEFQSRR